MAAKSSPRILGTHLQDIVDIGFGRWAKEEPLLAKTACLALQRLSEEDKDKLRSSSGRVFGALQSLVTGSWLPENIWYAAADKAISTIYAVHPTPETFSADIVKKSLSSVFGDVGKDDLPNSVDNENNAFLSSVPATKLGRFLFVISHIALNQLVYTESCVRKIQKQKGKKDKAEPVTTETVHIDPSKATEVQGINAELGIGTTIDAAIESLAERAEKEIVSGCSAEKNLIGYCAPAAKD